MSRCTRCGAQFGCAMADGLDAPCWCVSMPPLVAVPAADEASGCWCPACLKAHLEQQGGPAAPTPSEE